MQFLEALKLRSKLLFLFLLITLGLISVGIMGTIYVNAMKKNIDSLYFGSLVPVTELNEILQKYHNGLADTVYKASRNEMSSSEIIFNLEDALHDIDKKWKSYMSHFKTDEEMEYIEYTNIEIKATNRYFRQILYAAKNGKDLSQISINTLEKKVEYIHRVLQKLINYEVGVASFERKKFLHTYKSMLLQIGTVLSAVILIVLAILFYVFKSIQKDQTQLELAAKKLKIANKKLENASYTDSLTGLHNRRYFNFIYERELKRAKRNKTYITFMMLDIDYFKQYNDTYGHVEGDFALKSVAKVLKDTLKRPSDYVFRLGGEEFGVLMSETDESNSAKLAREICDAVRGRELKHEKSKVGEFVTISIGVVCCVADDALNDEILISRADEMLYEAKESGRDRYIITSNVSEATTKHNDEAKIA
ncbi:diguanylate cyclase [Sulfurimonas paralvinellae]|uniref:diguanylate cyclase n=1 Tax=Sulfurimonas paralvinellae TaxID=317658 RepID=A0A7M1B648_9BACT|nr:diguanylate cyclase [Sulfurimonas paralvinellae]QOP45209.1 diguanylate cyclase [Sulfurimonas paralvinellae]